MYGERIKSITVPIALVVASILVIFMLAETALRLSSFRSLLPYEGMPRGYYTESRMQGYDIAKNFATSTHRFADGSYAIWSNNIGCFDRNYDGETLFMYLTGDSFAWGFSAFPDKWGTVVEEETGTRVLKCGVPGYGTRQAYEKMVATLTALPKPQAIILSYFINDESDDAAFPNSLSHDGVLIKNLNTNTTKDYDTLMAELPAVAGLSRAYCMWNEPEHPYFQRAKCFLTRHSILYNVAKNAVKNIISLDTLRFFGIVNNPPEERGGVSRETEEPYAYLSQFKSFADGLGVALVVILVPPQESLEENVTDPYADVKDFMQKREISFLDLKDDFRKALKEGAMLYWSKDLHWNSEGNRLAGRLVSEYLIAHGLTSAFTEK